MYPTVVEVKTYLGIVGTTDDAWLTMMLAAVINSLEEYCQRRFEEKTDTEKWVNVHDRSSFFIYRYPLTSITAVRVDGAAYDVARVKPIGNLGEVLFNFPVSGDIEIDYVGGYPVLPPMIAYVVLQSVKDAYANKDVTAGTGGIKSERIDGVASISYFEADSGGGEGGGGAANAPPLIANHAMSLDSYLSDASIGGIA